VAVNRISREALDALVSYSWPGNVRELQNYIERAIILSEDDTISEQHLPEHLFDAEVAAQLTAPVLGSDAKELDDIDLADLIRHVVQRGMQSSENVEGELHSQVIDQFEKELLTQVLSRCGGIQTKAATMLGINRNTLYKKLKQFGLDQSEVTDEKDA
jgi:DNA-binding NtrC family response regulator